LAPYQAFTRLNIILRALHENKQGTKDQLTLVAHREPSLATSFSGNDGLTECCSLPRVWPQLTDREWLRLEEALSKSANKNQIT